MVHRGKCKSSLNFKELRQTQVLDGAWRPLETRRLVGRLGARTVPCGDKCAVNVVLFRVHLQDTEKMEQTMQRTDCMLVRVGEDITRSRDEPRYYI